MHVPVANRVPQDLVRVVAANVHRIRKGERKMSMEELGERTGLHRNTIAQLETEQPGDLQFSTVVALADALDVDVGELLARDDGPDVLAVERSLREFLTSSLAADVSPDEKKALRRMHWPWGAPTLKGWFHALEILRSTREG